MNNKQFVSYWLVNKKLEIVVIDGSIDGEYTIDEYSEYYANTSVFDESCVNEFGGMIFDKVFTEMGIYKVSMHQEVEYTPDGTYYNLYIDSVERVSELNY